MRPAILSFSALLSLTACDLVGPQDKLSHAAAWFMCGPADGPATAIVLAAEPVELHQPSSPRLEVTILQDVGAIAGHTWDLKGDSAYASYVIKQDSAEPVSSGTVRITSVDTANTIRGIVTARFGSRTVVHSFTAPWLQNRVLCG